MCVYVTEVSALHDYDDDDDDDKNNNNKVRMHLQCTTILKIQIS